MKFEELYLVIYCTYLWPKTAPLWQKTNRFPVYVQGCRAQLDILLLLHKPVHIFSIARGDRFSVHTHV